MSRSIADLNHVVSAWILGEKTAFREMAYTIARTYPNSAPLQDYLLGIIDNVDTPGIRKLKADLNDDEWEVLARRTLPWIDVWRFVRVDLCTTIGAELREREAGK